MAPNKTKPCVRQRIIDAFCMLLKEKPLQKITVSDVMRVCGMTRQMFYHYFNDLDELVFSILFEQADAIAKQFIDGEIFLNTFPRYMDILRENKLLYQNIVKKDGVNSYADIFYRLMVEYTEEFLTKYRRHKLTKDDQFAIRLYWRGFSAMMVEWINDGMKTPPSVMTERFFMCLPPIIKKHYESI